MGSNFHRCFGGAAVLPKLAARQSPCVARELEEYSGRRRVLPELPIAHGVVIAQFLLDVVVLCAKFGNVAFDVSPAMAA